MKQIYSFEQTAPPVLNENLLRTELEKQKLQRQTAILAAAGILLQIVVALFGLAAWEWYPLLTVLCLIYVLISATGSGILAVVCTRKGGLSL